MSERRGDGWWGAVEGDCPVQGCGRVDGRGWYFRARGQGWSLEIVDDASIDPETLPLVGYGVGGWMASGDWGDGPYEAGYMPDDVAWGLIERCFEAFRRGELAYARGR